MILPRWANRHARNRAHYRLKVVVGGLLLIVLLAVLGNGTTPILQFGRQSNIRPRYKAANSTLGFEKLLVLSSRPSWRTRGLAAAAELTGLNFSTPGQPHNPDEMVNAFEHIGVGKTRKRPQHGSAAAWIGHLDLLKHVVASGFETALIVEDDVDWDVRIKSQTQLISDNIRSYTNVPANDPDPYGTNWDVIWFGHCGASYHDSMQPPQVYADRSRTLNNEYVGWSKGYVMEHVPEGFRQIQVSAVTVCSFGYGVTQQSAQRILHLLGHGGDESFDVALSRNCAPGKLRCLVVNPQIMNHYEPPLQEVGYVSPVDSGEGEGQGQGQAEAVDEAYFESVKGITSNILNSARCRALFGEQCLPEPPEPPPAPEGEEQSESEPGESEGEGAQQLEQDPSQYQQSEYTTSDELSPILVAADTEEETGSPMMGTTEAAAEEEASEPELFP